MILSSQIYHWVLCNTRTNDALVGSTRICSMPEMHIQNRNNGAHPTMPKSGSSIDCRLKHQRATHNIQGLRHGPKYHGRPKQRVPHMELQSTAPQMLTDDAGHLQSFILWDNFSHGFLAVSWQTQQQNYYENKQLWCSAGKWVREILKWALKSARQQWDHHNDELHKKTAKLNQRLGD